MGKHSRLTLAATAMLTVAGCLPYPVSPVNELQQPPLLASLPIGNGPIAPASDRVGPVVLFADPGHGRGSMTVILPDGRSFEGGFMVIHRGWRGSDYPTPGPGQLEASLRDGLETMQCQLTVQDRTALAQAGVGTCDISDGSTTSVMW